MKTMMRWLWCMVLMVTACSGGGGTGQVEVSDRPWLHTTDFAANKNLHARPNQTVILPIDEDMKKDGPDGNTMHTVPYYLNEDGHFNFRLDVKDPCIAEIRVRDDMGQEVLRIDLQKPIVEKVHLKAGRYVFTVTEVIPMPAHCSLSFMHHGAPSLPKTTAANAKNGSPAAFMSGLFDKSIVRMFGQLTPDGTAYQVYLIDQFEPNDNPYTTFNFRVNNYYLGALIQAALPQGCGMTTSCPIAYYSPNYTFNLYYDATQDNNTGSWMLQGFGYNYGLLSCMIAPNNCGVPVNGMDAEYLCPIDTVRQVGHPYDGVQPILAFSNPIGATASGCYSYDNTHASFYRFTLDYWTPSAPNPRDLALGVYNAFCPTGDATCQWQFGSAFNTNFARYAVTPNTITMLGAVSKTIPYPYTAASYDRIRLTELYRYYPDASKLRDSNGNYLLTDGEVALFDGANYGVNTTSRAIVLNSDTIYTLLPIDFGTWFRVAGVMLGPNTATITFADGTTIGQSNPLTGMMNLQINGENGTIGVKVFRAIDVIFSNDCPSCNLAQVNISGKTFTNRNFSAAYFTKAVIKSSIFDGANLSSTDFTSATMTDNSFQKANMKDAVMQGANFSNSNFKGANLCRAKLNLLGGLAVGALLDGSYLQNVNLAYADLSGASLKNVSFNSSPPPAQGTTCIPDSNCNIGTCAGAYKATMNAATFAGAYLAGASFASATLTRSNFSGALAIGANFNGAVFNNDPSGQRTDFSGAYLFGADFTEATVQGVVFQGAFFDDPSGTYGSRVAISYLSTAYTNFMSSAYLNTYVCPQVTVAQASVVPQTTDASVICPNKNTGPCGTSDWIASGAPDPSGFALNTQTPYTIPSSCNGKTSILW